MYFCASRPNRAESYMSEKRETEPSVKAGRSAAKAGRSVESVKAMGFSEVKSMVKMRFR